MINTVGFDGFRLDFVRGFQVDFIANWINNLPKTGNQQKYIVAEYWTSFAYRLKDWVNANAAKGANVSVFDFILKNTLNALCNDSTKSFDMRELNHAGMVRENNGNSISGVSVSTFVDSHDTGKEHDKWIIKDWKLGYAYILTHEGRPCIFYPHFYGIRQVDNSNATITVQADKSLKEDIKKLIFVRRTYLGGVISVLTETGHPTPDTAVKNVYVARREGNGTKNGAIIVINNHVSQTMNIWVDNAPQGWQNWAGKWLKNAFNPNERIQVQADGRVNVKATPRGYAVYVLESDYVAYPKK
jgi:alpha-amylase